MKKEMILKNSKIIKKEFLLNFFIDKFYFTFSEMKEVISILYEIEIIKKIDLELFFKNINVEFDKSKKENSSVFLKYIREYRYPIYYNSNKKVKENISMLKRKNINISVPFFFEGDSIKLDLEFKSLENIDDLIEELKLKKDYIKEILLIVKRGG